MKILILTEGGKNIGFGHVSRMLAVYQAFEEIRVKPYILVKGDNSVEYVLREANWEIFDWIKYPDGIKNKFNNIDLLFIDSYIASAEIYEYLSEIAKFPVYYDDFGRIEYPCGIVVNGNIHAEKINYPKKECVKYLLGTEYLPIRREFWEIEEKRISGEMRKVLITFGGEDFRCMTSKVLKVLVSEFPDLHKKVVIGKGFRKEIINECKEIADKKTEFIYFPNAEGMKRLMLESDIAISGGGQTLYEMARVGLPPIAIVVADNQIMQVKSFFEKGFVQNFFYWDRLTEKDIITSVTYLSSLYLRREKSRIGRNLIKGCGVRKMVKELTKCIVRG